jgi:hypothetical protein
VQIYKRQGRVAEVEELQSRVLDGQRTVHDPEHPDTLGAIVNLAGVRTLLEDSTAKENGGTAKGGRMLDGRTWDKMPGRMVCVLVAGDEPNPVRSVCSLPVMA